MSQTFRNVVSTSQPGYIYVCGPNNNSKPVYMQPSFENLSDTPNTLVGNAGQFLAVNNSETGLIFVPGSTGPAVNVGTGLTNHIPVFSSTNPNPILSDSGISIINAFGSNVIDLGASSPFPVSCVLAYIPGGVGNLFLGTNISGSGSNDDINIINQSTAAQQILLQNLNGRIFLTSTNNRLLNSTNNHILTVDDNGINIVNQVDFSSIAMINGAGIDIRTTNTPLSLITNNVLNIIPNNNIGSVDDVLTNIGTNTGSSNWIRPRLNTFDYSVNSASCDAGYVDRSIVLRTGSVINAAGSYNGGGVGNKAIYGYSKYLDGTPLINLTSLEFVWENVVGLGGPNFLPPTIITTLTPYINLNVDFSGVGTDIRVLIIASDQLNTLITNSIGSYVNNGLNVLTYSWNATQNVCIVNSPPNSTPGGVLPDVTVGPSFLNNSYKFSDLISANPAAIIKDAYTGDGGLPSGAITPGLILCSGDSGNVSKSGKKIKSIKVNNIEIL